VREREIFKWQSKLKRTKKRETCCRENEDKEIPGGTLSSSMLRTIYYTFFCFIFPYHQHEFGLWFIRDFFEK